jgi:hypothetical protein
MELAFPPAVSWSKCIFAFCSVPNWIIMVPLWRRSGWTLWIEANPLLRLCQRVLSPISFHCLHNCDVLVTLFTTFLFL